MSLDTKPNLDKSKFEQLEGDILNLSGCTNIYGCLDVKKSGVINSNNGYDISGITQIRLGEDITAIAIGSDAYSKCCNSIAIGYCSSATGRCAISIGALSQVISSNSIAIGNSSIVCDQQSVAIGSSSKAYKFSSVAVGNSSMSNTLYGVSIGANAGSCYDNYFQTVVGGYAGSNSITCDITALGFFAETSSSGSTHIGIGSLAGVMSCGCSTIMIGSNAGYKSCGDLNIFIGHGVGCENTDSGKFILGNCYYELGCRVLICGNFFTGNVTIPKLSGLTSSAVGVDCNGTLMRIFQPSGNISWVGNTVGGVGTYVNNTTICSQPNIKYISNELHIIGKTFINGLTNAQTNNVVYYDINTNELKQSNLINGNNAATLFNDNGVVGVTNLYWDDSVSGFTWGTGYTPTNNDIFTIIKDHDYHDTGYDGYITFGTCSYEMLNGTNLSIGYCADYNYECILGYNKINSEIPLCINSDVLLLPNYRITTTNYANFVNNKISSSIGSVINGFVFNNNLDSISKEYVTRYEYIKCLATSDASPNVIWDMVLSGNKFANLLYNICVTGIGAVSGDSAAFILNGLIKYTCCGDLITFVGTPTKTTYKDSSMSVADVDVCLLSGFTSRRVVLYICGVSSKNIVWSAFVDALKTDLC